MSILRTRMKFVVTALTVAVAALALTSNLHAAPGVSVFIEGGSASQNVLYDRATNLFAGGSFTSTGTGDITKTGERWRAPPERRQAAE